MNARIPYRPRQWAIPFHRAMLRVRWAALVLHRRAGKTTAVLNHHQKAALDDKWEATRLRNLEPKFTERDIKDLLRARRYGHVLPTLKQAKFVAWEPLKYYASTIPGIKINESDLQITYPGSGATVRLFGADNPDSFRGAPFSGISFDEYSQMPPNIFSEVISKSLADHLGYAMFVGTIKGKNQLYRAHQAAVKNPGDWFGLWQDINVSLKMETGATILALQRAMYDDRKLIDQGQMTQEEFDQEWFLSTDAAIKGAYYQKQLSKIRKDKQITIVPYDPSLPVDTDWDLGIDDLMSIWFSQSLKSGQVRLIDYYSNSGEGIPHYVNVLNQRGYTYGKHYAPHDIGVRELGTGKSRKEVAAKLGLNFETVPDIGLASGIEAVRLLLPRCWFDETKTEAGLEGLTHYRKTWNEKIGEFTDTPVHDWSSHPADAFRGLAVRHKTPTDKKKKPPAPPPPQMPAGLGWMR